MPYIRTSSDLKNHYNEISEICHRCGEAVYITGSENGDLAVMSVEAYEKMADRLELYDLIEKGLEDEKAGRTIPAKEAFSKLRKSFYDGTL